jgi:predicted DNA-binding ArsR family transcriptional regulator
VSRECGLVNSEDKVLVPYFSKDDEVDDQTQIFWHDVDSDENSSTRTIYSTQALLVSDVFIRTIARTILILFLYRHLTVCPAFQAIFETQIDIT